jgi:hypothetical protein
MQEKPTRDYQPPATEFRAVPRATRIAAAIATLCFLALAVWLWRTQATDSSMAALSGAVFCLLLAVGAVKTKQDKRS